MKPIIATITLSSVLIVPASMASHGPESGVNAFFGVQGFYVNESVEVANHHIFPGGPEVDGATILVRDFRSKVVRIEVTSAALDPDTAYSIWLAVFNSPKECATPGDCTPADLGNPDVRASVFWGGGLISDAEGYGDTSMVLQPGKTNRELFANMSDLGLQDMRNAHIHVVLRSHGPTGVAGSVADQIGTAFLACPPANCVNAFASVHIPN